MYNMNPMNYSVSYDEEHKFAILQALCDLDDELVSKLSQDARSTDERNLYNGCQWLKSDVVSLLIKCEDIPNLVSQIEGIIKESPFSDVILNEFINLDELIDEAEIRSDFFAALKKVENGRELAPRIGYAFSKADIKALALLHKEGKQRTKIESLLEACNFHYENGKFFRGEYEEFLSFDSETGEC